LWYYVVPSVNQTFFSLNSSLFIGFLTGQEQKLRQFPDHFIIPKCLVKTTIFCAKVWPDFV